jgi:hypothetical protein
MGFDHMSLRHHARVVAGACLFAGTLLGAVPVRAAPADYRFEIVQVQSAEPGKSNITVRLVHAPDNKPVPDAVIFQSAADMGPDGMPTMTAPVKAVPASQPGTYAFEIQPGMAGNWELKLAAKVQGETGTVNAALPVKLAK